MFSPIEDAILAELDTRYGRSFQPGHYVRALLLRTGRYFPAPAIVTRLRVIGLRVKPARRHPRWRRP